MKTTRDIAEVKKKDVCMRLALMCAAVLFCLVSVAGPAWADCATQRRDCITDHGKGKNVGKASVTQCWDGWGWRCNFCGGDKQPAKNCEKEYPNDCKDRSCWWCGGGKHGCCMDKNGHTHGNCD
jgi:hypothetical protein